MWRRKRQLFIPHERHCPGPSLETRGFGPWVGAKAGALEKSLGNCASVAPGRVEQAIERREALSGPVKVQGKRGRVEGRTIVRSLANPCSTLEGGA